MISVICAFITGSFGICASTPTFCSSFSFGSPACLLQCFKNESSNMLSQTVFLFWEKYTWTCFALLNSFGFQKREEFTLSASEKMPFLPSNFSWAETNSGQNTFVAAWCSDSNRLSMLRNHWYFIDALRSYLPLSSVPSTSCTIANTLVFSQHLAAACLDQKIYSPMQSKFMSEKIFFQTPEKKETKHLGNYEFCNSEIEHEMYIHKMMKRQISCRQNAEKNTPEKGCQMTEMRQDRTLR